MARSLAASSYAVVRPSDRPTHFALTIFRPNSCAFQYFLSFTSIEAKGQPQLAFAEPNCTRSFKRAAWAGMNLDHSDKVGIGVSFILLVQLLAVALEGRFHHSRTADIADPVHGTSPHMPRASSHGLHR